MKWLSLIFTTLLRNRRRTLLTMGAVALALFIFTTLQTILAALSLQVASGLGETRLGVIEKYGGPRKQLPESYWAQLARFDHVTAVTPMDFTVVSVERGAGVYYIAFAIDPEQYRIVFASTAVQVPSAQYDQFIRTRNGVLVGVEIMQKYGWTVGDNIRVRSLLHHTDFDLTICGALESGDASNRQIQTQMLLNRGYYEQVLGNPGKSNVYWLRLDEPASVLPVIKAVTDYYSSGPNEVSVETESSMLSRFSAFTATIQLVIQVISVVVLVTILIVAANTIALTMRERKKEIALMKALGYTQERVLGLIVAEAAVTSLVAGLAGTLAAYGLFSLRSLTISFGVALDFKVTPELVAVGVLVSLALGVLSGVFPAYRASRVNVIKALHSL